MPRWDGTGPDYGYIVEVLLAHADSAAHRADDAGDEAVSSP